MALGFIKKVFTFGKAGPAEAPTPEEAPAFQERAGIAAESEPHSRHEDLPVSPVDPVASMEMQTAGGPAGDDDLEIIEPGPVSVEEEEEAPAILPGIEDIADIGMVPLSLLEAESEAGTEESPVAEVPLEPVLPRGFSTRIEAVPEPEVEAPRLTWYQRLTSGLARTSSQLTGQITALFTKRKLDDQTLEDLEDLLIQADLGVETAMRITGALSAERYGKDVTGEDVSRIMAAEISKVLAPVAKPLALDLSHKPHVILVVGVNGTGKTTTIGKLAAKLSGSGLKVMLAAGDTFRAAAIEQLKIWADRTGSEFIGTKLGADAAGLAYDAFEQARAKKSDVLIIDTAGRLQNKAELMAELEKIVRVLGKLDPEAPHTVLQTLDATTGQNALSQVEIFRNIAGVNGLIMTKLDGTARGGILVGIAAKHRLPVYFIGVGEGVEDLEPFEADEFAKAIAGLTH
jgi:fused signal recognition particle receptor